MYFQQVVTSVLTGCLTPGDKSSLVHLLNSETIRESRVLRTFYFLIILDVTRRPLLYFTQAWWDCRSSPCARLPDVSKTKRPSAGWREPITTRLW
jgi:hypothetical protein